MAKQHEGQLTCSFCGKSQREVRKLIAGPTVYICDECIKLCNDILAQEAERSGVPPDETAPRPMEGREAKKSRQMLCCSFCGKSQREVKKLIAGPSTYICDECIGLCNDIIAEEIDREDRTVLRANLPRGVRALIAGILERGLPAARRIQHIRNDDIIEDTRRRRAAGEPPDELLWGPWVLAADWIDLHNILTKAARANAESGEDDLLSAELPEWVSPIAERLAGTLEVLGSLPQRLESPGLEEVRQLRPSVEIAREKLCESRELLLAAPP